MSSFWNFAIWWPQKSRPELRFRKILYPQRHPKIFFKNTCLGCLIPERRAKGKGYEGHGVKWPSFLIPWLFHIDVFLEGKMLKQKILHTHSTRTHIYTYILPCRNVVPNYSSTSSIWKCLFSRSYWSLQFWTEKNLIVVLPFLSLLTMEVEHLKNVNWPFVFLSLYICMPFVQ